MLARCPCGKVPTDLNVVNYYTYKWAHVSGNCCGEWEVEFRAQYAKDDELIALATEAWNRATRAPDLDRQEPEYWKCEHCGSETPVGYEHNCGD